MPTPVIVNDVIILLTLTTRPKEEGSSAFHCPPEVHAVNDRSPASMNHLGRRAHSHGIQDQDHSVIIIKVSRMSIRRCRTRNDAVTYPSSFRRPYVCHPIITELRQKPLPSGGECVRMRLRKYVRRWRNVTESSRIKRYNKRHSFLLTRQGTMLVIVIARSRSIDRENIVRVFFFLAIGN